LATCSLHGQLLAGQIKAIDIPYTQEDWWVWALRPLRNAMAILFLQEVHAHFPRQHEITGAKLAS